MELRKKIIGECLNCLIEYCELIQLSACVCVYGRVERRVDLCVNRNFVIDCVDIYYFYFLGRTFWEHIQSGEVFNEN